MKTLTVLTILLIFSLVNILHAGLDTDALFNHVIAVYHFESTKTTDSGLLYTEDSGPQDLPGFLFDGASLVEGGKSGKCLSLVGDDTFAAGTGIFPHLASVGFSIVAWVKRPQQNAGLVFSMIGVYAEDRENVVSEIDLGVTPTGNIKGTHVTYPTDTSAVLTTQDENISNNRWHHIAYTLFANTYMLFINGEAALKHEATVFPGYFGDEVLFFISSPDCAKRIGEETLRCPRCGSLLKEEQPQEEMDPELYARVKTLVIEQTGFVSKEKLTPETHLADDLGIAGDDGYELLEAFCEEFEIQNMSQIEPSKYFGTEGGPNPFFIYVFFYDLVFGRKELKDTDSSVPLYLRDLVKSAEAKRWIPPEI